MHLIDTHTHLDAVEFDSDREAVIARASAADVKTLITIGSGYGAQSASRALAIAEAHPNVFAAVGFHPNDAAQPAPEDFLDELAAHPKVVAIGETGLDFYRDHARREDQERWFRMQIRLALKVNKPLVIHSREAGEACFAILKEEGAATVGGVFHCFAEDEHFSERLKELNFIISVPGNVTFKKADKLRRVVQATELNRIMLETDAPYLAPEPFRGKRCESAFVLETARFVAQLKRISLEELAQVTTANAMRLFRLGL